MADEPCRLQKLSLKMLGNGHATNDSFHVPLGTNCIAGRTHTRVGAEGFGEWVLALTYAFASRLAWASSVSAGPGRPARGMIAHTHGNVRTKHIQYTNRTCTRGSYYVLKAVAPMGLMGQLQIASLGTDGSPT